HHYVVADQAGQAMLQYSEEAEFLEELLCPCLSPLTNPVEIDMVDKVERVIREGGM
ncbi:hypothetical protein KIPB_010324, partial [Kipferlia bialata]